MAKNVFDRLGMAATSYVRDERITGDLYTGYVTEFDELALAPYRDIIVAGAGSVFSSVNDMARYVAALLNDGANAAGRVLGADAFRELYSPQPTAMPEGPMQMGLAFIVTAIDEHRVVWHNGGWPGANSEMWLAPDDGFGVLAFTNTFSASASGRMDQFAQSLLGLVLAG
jgi:CubicO group peptidase (beta-lactamase class C family)